MLLTVEFIKEDDPSSKLIVSCSLVFLYIQLLSFWVYSQHLDLVKTHRRRQRRETFVMLPTFGVVQLCILVKVFKAANFVFASMFGFSVSKL